MKANAINVGDTLRLKSDNAYGFGPRLVTVAALRYRPGYKVPHVMSGSGEAFRPSDFAGKASA